MMMLIQSLVVFSGLPANDLFGSDGCKCVDPWKNERLGSMPNTSIWTNGTCVLVPGTTACLDPTWGALCESYHEVTAACKMLGVSSEAMPDYCDKPWCYVDPLECDKYHAPSRFTGLRYSFETCGHRNYFDVRDQFVGILDGKTLRVGFPPNNGKCAAFSMHLTLDYFFRVCRLHGSKNGKWRHGRLLRHFHEEHLASVRCGVGY
jgi:hypothetical protein